MTRPGRLDPRALRDLIEAGTALTLLDVREPFERAVAVIAVPPGSMELAIPMREVAASLERIKAADFRPIVVYCHHGVRSLHAADWLVAQGLEGLQNLDGGIDAWSILVDPETPRY